MQPSPRFPGQCPPWPNGEENWSWLSSLNLILTRDSEICMYFMSFSDPLASMAFSHVRSFQIFCRNPLASPSLYPNFSYQAYLPSGKRQEERLRLPLQHLSEEHRSVSPLRSSLTPEEDVWESHPRRSLEALWGQEGRGHLYILQLKPPGYMLLEDSKGAGYLSGCFTISEDEFLSYTHLWLDQRDSHVSEWPEVWGLQIDLSGGEYD